MACTAPLQAFAQRTKVGQQPVFSRRSFMGLPGFSAGMPSGSSASASSSGNGQTYTSTGQGGAMSMSSSSGNAAYPLRDRVHTACKYPGLRTCDIGLHLLFLSLPVLHLAWRLAGSNTHTTCIYCTYTSAVECQSTGCNDSKAMLGLILNRTPNLLLQGNCLVATRVDMAPLSERVP
jgi:hypothetical protein